MMKSIKKIVAMALLLTTTLGTAAFAEEKEITNLDELNGVQVEVTSTTEIPKISVTVPTSASFIINPFSKEVGEDSTSSKQIISTDITIKNGSEVAVDVVLDGLKATVQSDSSTDKITLASAAIPTSTTSSKKDVFLYLGVKDDEGNVTFDAKNNAKQVVKASATTGLNVKLGTMAANDEDGDTDELTLAFDGSVNKNASWTTGDSLSVVPTFRFVAQTAVSE